MLPAIHATVPNQTVCTLSLVFGRVSTAGLQATQSKVAAQDALDEQKAKLARLQKEEKHVLDQHRSVKSQRERLDRDLQNIRTEVEAARHARSYDQSMFFCLSGVVYHIRFCLCYPGVMEYIVSCAVQGTRAPKKNVTWRRQSGRCKKSLVRTVYMGSLSRSAGYQKQYTALPSLS